MSPVPPPTLGLAPGSDTGVSHADGITDDTTPIVVGVAAAGANITLLDEDGTVLGTTRADAKGNYLLASATLADGPHALTVTQTVAGTTISSAPLDLDVEEQATATSTAAAVPETATSLTFSVQFDQPVSVISPTSFVLATTGTVYGNVTAVSGSGETYTVTVTGLGGEGTVGLAFSAYTPTDVSGNQVALTKSVGHDVSDTTAPTTVLVTSDQFGVAGTGGTPAISGGGRIVAFISDDPDLVPSITTQTGIGNIYVKDIQTGAIALVDNGNDQSYDVQISYDGTVVAFSSLATNLMPGGTPVGQLNLYTAQLTSATSAGGLSFVPGSIRLVATLDTDVAEGLTQDAFALSGDGSTLAFGTEAALPGGAGGGDNSYAYNLATGAYTLIPGAVSGEITSISSAGTKVAYNASVAVPGTGGQPDLEFGGTLPPASVEDAFVFNTATKTTTSIDGSGVLPDTSPPTAGGEVASYATADPVLTGNGNTVVFQLTRGSELSSLFSVNLSGPTHTMPISPGAATDGAGDYDSDQTASFGGGVIAYDNNDPTNGITSEVYSAADGGGTSTLGPAIETLLSAQGNAVALVDYTDASGTTPAVYETSLGVSASIAPINGNDTIDKTDLALATADGIAISGTSNAPAGSPVLLYVTRATASGSLDPFTTAVGEDGQWTATLPEEQAAVLTDGPYFLTVQVSDASGASPQVSRLFTVDTVAPAAPTAPVLDQGSNTGKDGVDTNDSSPTLDGQTEPGAFVTLFDTSGGGRVPLATATADQTGIYTLTSSALADGAHVLATQAQDDAGNASPLSATTTIKVDTVAPPKPPAPQLAAGQDDDALVQDTTNVAAPVLIGSTEPGDTVTLYDGSTPLTTVKAASDGSYTVKTPTLSDGDHSLVVVATDLAGNTGPASDPLDLTIDTVAPGAPLLGSVTGETLSDGGLSPSFDVTGTAAAGTAVTLQVDGVSVPADAADTRNSGAYSIAVPDLSPGVHSLSVLATDGAGNVSQPSAATTVTISSLAPGIPGPSSISGTLTDGPIAGATVFADANGNGVLDAGETSAVTTPAGQFTLPAPSGELIATGGIDTVTGLTLPWPADGTGRVDGDHPTDDTAGRLRGHTGGHPRQRTGGRGGGARPRPGDRSDTARPGGGGGGRRSQLPDRECQCDRYGGQFRRPDRGADRGQPSSRLRSRVLGPGTAGRDGNAQPGQPHDHAGGARQRRRDCRPWRRSTAKYSSSERLYCSNRQLRPQHGGQPPQRGDQPGLHCRGGTGRTGTGRTALRPHPLTTPPATSPVYTPTDLGEQVTAAETPVLAAPVLAPGQDTGISPYDNDTSITDPGVHWHRGARRHGADRGVISRPAWCNPTRSWAPAPPMPDGVYSITAQLSTDLQRRGRDPSRPRRGHRATGSPISVPNLPASKVTLVIAGNLATTKYGLPKIQDVSYVASSANDATHSAIYIDGIGSVAYQPDGIYTLTADGNPTPLGTSSAQERLFSVS